MDQEYHQANKNLLGADCDNHRTQESVNGYLGTASSPPPFSSLSRRRRHPSNLSVRCLEIILPMESNIDMGWKQPLKDFLSSKSSSLGLNKRKMPKDVRLYYAKQDELIDAYESLNTDSNIELLCDNNQASTTLVTRLSQISFLANFILLVAKAVAVGLSNSLSIISSLVDSVVDLFSGIVIWKTSNVMKNTDIYVYPIGRSRLEPVALIILSVVMSLASFQVLLESVKKMVSYSSQLDSVPKFEIPTLVIAASTVVLKFFLAVTFYLLIKKKKIVSAPINALVQDHRNDTLSNFVAILCGYLGSEEFSKKVGTKQTAYIDPAGAVVIALYIIASWWRTGSEQLRMIAGHTADASFHSQITWIALNHSPQILFIETVRAFHFGFKFLVEVDIVLDGNTKLEESHNIGESLQVKIEKLPLVERAFVHVDYEWDHRPADEHIV